MANWSIINFKLLPGHKISVLFADGTSGTADLSPRLSQGRLGDGFDPLCDESVFSQVCLEFGALTWPGGIDLAPDALYEQICETGAAVLKAKNKKAA